MRSRKVPAIPLGSPPAQCPRTHVPHTFGEQVRASGACSIIPRSYVAQSFPQQLKMARAMSLLLILTTLSPLHAASPQQQTLPAEKEKPFPKLKTIPTFEDLFVDIPKAVEACPPLKGRVVLSIAFFPKAETLFPFVRSWQTHSPHTRLVLFTNTEEVYRMLHEPPNVHVVMSKPMKVTWSTWRMFGYAYFLELCQSKGLVPSAAAVIDARDSIALSNVWEHPTAALGITGNMVVAPLEGNVGEGGVPIDKMMADEAMNMMWIKKCFTGILPQEAIEWVARYPVSCSGTVLGSGQAMLAYTRALVDLTLNATGECLYSPGSDQGVHNMLIWWGRHHGLLKHDVLTPHNGKAFVYTVQFGRPLEMNRYGVVRVTRPSSTPGGAPWTHLPAYLHQYDRDKNLTARIRELFSIATTA